eukprot:COSAG01_NODE_13634_length_1555_cov_303.164835_3_plen_107_part_00
MVLQSMNSCMCHINLFPANVVETLCHHNLHVQTNRWDWAVSLAGPPACCLHMVLIAPDHGVNSPDHGVNRHHILARSDCVGACATLTHTTAWLAAPAQGGRDIAVW